MTRLEATGRYLDMQMSQLETAYRLRNLCPDAYQQQAIRVHIAYLFWREALAEATQWQR